MRNIIHIFGASGSGTTTLGKYLSEKLGFKFMDTDDYFWMPTDPKYTVKRPIQERIKLMLDDINSNENIVISGSLVDWGDELIPYFTLAVRLETESSIRIARLRNREKETFGDRIEFGGDMYQTHSDFIEWAKKYDTAGTEMRSKAKHDEWQKLLGCKLLQLNGNDSLQDNFSIIESSLTLPS